MILNIYRFVERVKNNIYIVFCKNVDFYSFVMYLKDYICVVFLYILLVYDILYYRFVLILVYKFF